jgi:endonuclease YncB( thermonuclease family)
MKRICQKCQKVNDFEIRVCTCGHEFLKDLLNEQEFTPYKKNSKTFQKILSFGVFLFLGLSFLAFFMEPDFFLEKFGTGKSPRNENEAAVRDASNALYSLTGDAQPSEPLSTRVIQAFVSEVNSGDRIIIRDNVEGKSIQLKLAGIKAPAVTDQFGINAQKNLSDLILHKSVSVVIANGTGNEPVVGKVIYQDNDMNLAQLKSGFVTRDISNEFLLTEIERKSYQDAEYVSTTNKIGLWGDTLQEPVSVSDNSTKTDVKAEIIQPDGLSGRSRTVGRVESARKAETAVQTAGKTKNNAEPPDVRVKANAAPVPTARCLDGTLSFSPSKSGACSSHGGVADWHDDSKKASSAEVKPAAKKYLLGSRGGCYFVNNNGTKIYVDRTMCG